ncbi:MAG: hypothetical protein K2X38_02185 [Gemmataceae bacterium]|nr:hypothetical protein [Gemmataceae bacterium]
MGSSLRASLDALKQSSTILNSTVDEASELVLALEDYLTKTCGVGMDLHVSAGNMADLDPGAANPELEVFLGYGRIGGKYRITIATRPQNGGDLDEAPWTDYNRTLKLATVRYLPELVERLAMLMNVLAARTKESTESVIAEIRKQIPKGGKK